MHVLLAASTDLFVGADGDPHQVVRVTVVHEGSEPSPPATVAVEGHRLTTPDPTPLAELTPGEQRTVEVGVRVDGERVEGQVLPAEVVLRTADAFLFAPLDFVVAEPGWRMFMVSHFHYDPVWWNTQAAYTETWEKRVAEHSWERDFQQPAFTLVKAHLDMARRDADYRFVLAELDYLKPYWDVYPEDRELVRRLLAEGRLELIGGTYNEPNTNLTSAETTARNAIYGIGYQRDVLGGAPATAWQLDVFGHDPQFPGLMADAGLTSSSWARGPFHEWGPNWSKGGMPELRWKYAVGGNQLMQFSSEFDWVSPSGAGVLTSYMANHYSAGWWMDAAPTLAEAEAETYRLFRELKAVAATRNVLLPVGTDYTPPNRWVTEIQRDWNARYLWPRFVSATAADFFAAVHAELEREGRGLSPQTRDMNPVYTGKDVSYIDTKQMQRVAENTLLAAERFATVAALLGARYPTEAIDKAWRQLLFGAHHDGITGSESDQVYLDLLAGWREALELARDCHDRALLHIGRQLDTSGDGVAVTVFNPLSWPRTDLVRAQLAFDRPGTHGVLLRDGDGERVAFCLERAERHDDGSLAAATVAFVARDVPGVGYRTYRAVAADGLPDDAAWAPADGVAIENDRYRVEVDPAQGGAISRLYDKRAGKELLKPGGLANELLAYDEYPQHPHFAEGPWHLTPRGTASSGRDFPAEVTAERCAVGRRVTVRGPFTDCTRTQEVVLWDGLDRVELRTHLDDWAGQDRLFRVRVAADVEGGMPVSEVADAVVGRGFGLPNVDVDDVHYTLDNPAYNWFEVGATAKVVLASGRARAIGVAEVVVPAGAASGQPVRDVVTALVRAGVTSTVSEDGANRYGSIDLDSNLPDVRVALGGPVDNRFTAAVLAQADPAYAQELDRQLAAQGGARVWVPAERPLSEVWQPNADLRGTRDLPVLIVAGEDAEKAAAAAAALVEDLGDFAVGVDQPAELDGVTGSVEDYGVAMLNRGIPGFSVDASGDLYLSLMRSCSGWPSGIWIDPPRRTVPDGSNFQFQHWSHTFEYAIVGHAGDWRAGEVVRHGHEYNNPLVARVLAPHPGTLPATQALLAVEPATVVLSALKPTGNALARMAGTHEDPAQGVVLRAYESTGRPARATARFFRPLRDGFASGLLEEDRRPLATEEGALRFDVDGFGIATVGAVPEAPAVAAHGDGTAVELGPRAEPAQPVYADYWLHNKGAGPLGYQTVTVQVVPTALRADGAFQVPIVVASSRTDAPVAGRVVVDVPPGWRADPPERLYRLAPGAHVAVDTVVTPATGAAPGRYFVAARITDDAGQVHEDVVTVDHRTGSDGRAPAGGAELTVDATTRKAAVREPAEAPEGAGLADELVVEVPPEGVRVPPGGRGSLVVSLRNRAAGEVRGEAQLLSPLETWDAITPWSQGFSVAAGAEQTVAFAVDVPAGARPGTWWALVKVMYFGRIAYSQAVPVLVPSRVAAVTGR